MSTDSPGIKITAPEVKQTQGEDSASSLESSINIYWVVLSTCFVQGPGLTMESVYHVQSGMYSAGESIWKCNQTDMHSDSKYELPLSFLAKSIANQPLNSFSLSPDTVSKSFSAEHSREPLLTEQSRHTRWNLFALPTIPNHWVSDTRYNGQTKDVDNWFTRK